MSTIRAWQQQTKEMAILWNSLRRNHQRRSQNVEVRNIVDLLTETPQYMKVNKLHWFLRFVESRNTVLLKTTWKIFNWYVFNKCIFFTFLRNENSFSFWTDSADSSSEASSLTFVNKMFYNFVMKIFENTSTTNNI
jgi:hypothetical protein